MTLISNVLLDEDFNSRLGDFGLARLIDHHKLKKTTLMAGTLGYIDAELHYTGKASRESDVHSFGILMLEVIYGKKPIDVQIEDLDENYSLVQNLWRADESGNILSAIDPELLVLYSHQLTPSNSSTQTSSKSSPLTCNFMSTPPQQHPVKVLCPQIPRCANPSRLCIYFNWAYSVACRIRSLLHSQGSAIAENPITSLHMMPPLLLTMPVSRYVPRALKSILMPPGGGNATFCRGLMPCPCRGLTPYRCCVGAVSSEPGL